MRICMSLAAAALLLLFLGGATWGTTPLAPAAPAAPGVGAGESLVTEATKSEIQIGLTYKGDRIDFFGVSPAPDADLIIRLTAAKSEEIKLSMKGRVGPFWMTVKQYDITGIPFMYKLHANKPIDQIIPKDTQEQLGIGYHTVAKQMKMTLARGTPAPGDEQEVFKGLIKIKERANLYRIVEDPERTKILQGKLFKHYFTFPPAATEGKYLVETFAFVNGRLVGQGKDEITITKVGLEHWFTQTSQNSPAFFGIFSIVVALGAGLGVGMIFRKGGHH
jgi:uncharacterized protein (TIGR02186 family)